MQSQRAWTLLLIAGALLVIAILVVAQRGLITADNATGSLSTAVALSALAVCGATIWNVRLTAEMCKEMRDARLAQYRPLVVVDFDFELRDEVITIWLSVMNRGVSPAADLHVKVFDRSVGTPFWSIRTERDPTGQKPRLDQKLDILGPNRDVSWWLVAFREAIDMENMLLMDEHQGYSYLVEMTYRDPFTQIPYQGSYAMDAGRHLAIKIDAWLWEGVASGELREKSIASFSRSTRFPASR